MDVLQKEMVLNGRYEILDSIGKGSFGVTYKAYDKKLNRDIALKVCFPADCCHLGDNGEICPKDKELYEKSLLDMVNEARTLATIKHPRVVTIHDVEPCENFLYCIMEWVEGETLRARMDRADGRVDESTAYCWLVETLQALAYIHDQNIVHRDLKPANIIIRPSSLGRGEELVLVDFGSALNRTLKEGKTVLGPYTPAYAAPEQMSGQRKIGAWTDMYSLAATFYELLGGRPVHSFDDGQLPELKLRSKRMEKSIMKNLNFDPKDRCSTAREWLNELADPYPCEAVVVEIQKLIHTWMDKALNKAGKKGLKTADVDEICNNVRDFFVQHLGKVPAEIDVKINAVQTLVSPARLAKAAARQKYGAIVGGAAGAGLIGGGAAIAGGAGAGLWGAIVALIFGGPVAVPIAMGAGGLALIGLAIKTWMGKSQAQRSTEALELLSKGLEEAISQCWSECGVLWKP